MSGKKASPEIPDEVIESLARTILPGIREYFDSEEGQKEFAARKKRRNRR